MIVKQTAAVLLVGLLLSISFDKMLSMGGKVIYPPLKPSKCNIADKESLDYIFTISGTDYDLRTVSRIIPDPADPDSVMVYYQIIDPNGKDKMPSNYSNFDSHMLVSLKNGSVLESQLKSLEVIRKTNTKGYTSSLKVDFDNKIAIYNNITWDGLKLTQNGRSIYRSACQPIYQKHILLG